MNRVLLNAFVNVWVWADGLLRVRPMLAREPSVPVFNGTT